MNREFWKKSENSPFHIKLLTHDKKSSWFTKLLLLFELDESDRICRRKTFPLKNLRKKFHRKKFFIDACDRWRKFRKKNLSEKNSSSKIASRENISKFELEYELE